MSIPIAIQVKRVCIRMAVENGQTHLDMVLVSFSHLAESAVRYIPFNRI